MERPTETLVQLMVMKLAILSAAVAVGVATQALPGCDQQCGNLTIPYPFGVKKECYLNENFSITCDHSASKAYLTGSNIVVTNISISGELHILQPIARDCYPQPGPYVSKNLVNLSLPAAFPISNTENKFTAVGCDTIALIYGELDKGVYLSGCISVCLNDSTLGNGSCSGSGCCEVKIPKGLRNLTLQVSSSNNHSWALEFNPCGYAFVIGGEEFEVSWTLLRNYTKEEVPLVLDWAIRNDTCPTTESKTNCICGEKSMIDFLEDGSEYHCQCLEGFKGNPYLSEGCQNINECVEGLHNCTHWCEDTDGSYTCKCPKGHKGDGRRDGNGCTKNSFVQIIVGIGVGFTALLIGSTWLYLGYKKWKFIQRKDEFFKKNGGFMLQQHLSQWQSTTDTVRIFTQEELEKATSNYDDSAVVGKGGYGTVYKGVLDEGLVVAIKKSKLVDQSQTAQFINEVIVLSQINHRNVVRLLGCCLETQVPLLVYEFIANGTLFDHIHNKSNSISFSWEARLKIASETAGVLSYLHSSASTPIIHRDIKSTNILLDDNYTAKVSDFGASKLVPMDQTQISTMVQGTLGYLDPEYLLTSELTEKSDVYSFGIVLLELLTGKKAVCFDGPEVERNLAMYVLCAMKEDRLEEVVVKGMATSATFKQIKEAAKLATKCLRIKGDERPTMKEVAMELEGLKVMQVELLWVNNNLSNAEEMAYLRDGAPDSNQFVVTGSSINVADDSIRAQILPQIHDGR